MARVGARVAVSRWQRQQLVGPRMSESTCTLTQCVLYDDNKACFQPSLVYALTGGDRWVRVRACEPEASSTCVRHKRVSSISRKKAIGHVVQACMSSSPSGLSWSFEHHDDSVVRRAVSVLQRHAEEQRWCCVAGVVTTAVAAALLLLLLRRRRPAVAAAAAAAVAAVAVVVALVHVLFKCSS
jgi:hypothetical protein